MPKDLIVTTARGYPEGLVLGNRKLVIDRGRDPCACPVCGSSSPGLSSSGAGTVSTFGSPSSGSFPSGTPTLTPPHSGPSIITSGSGVSGSAGGTFYSTYPILPCPGPMNPPPCHCAEASNGSGGEALPSCGGECCDQCCCCFSTRSLAGFPDVGLVWASLYIQQGGCCKPTTADFYFLRHRLNKPCGFFETWDDNLDEWTGEAEAYLYNEASEGLNPCCRWRVKAPPKQTGGFIGFLYNPCVCYCPLQCRFTGGANPLFLSGTPDTCRGARAKYLQTCISGGASTCLEGGYIQVTLVVGTPNLGCHPNFDEDGGRVSTLTQGQCGASCTNPPFCQSGCGCL